MPAASCRRCAKITGAFEQICSRKMLGDFRVKFKLPTRRKKERPAKLKVMDLNHRRVAQAAEQAIRSGQRTFSVPVDTLEVLPAEQPINFILPQFNPPRILLGQPRQPDKYPYEQSFWGIASNTELAQLRSQYGQVSPYPAQCHVPSFVRMLAKISHAGAAAGFGIDSFRPLLPDLILGKLTDFLDLVGGELARQPKVTGKYETRFSTPTILGRCYLVSHFRLFPEFGTPQYHVVVGEIDGPMSALITKPSSPNSHSMQPELR